MIQFLINVCHGIYKKTNAIYVSFTSHVTHNRIILNSPIEVIHANSCLCVYVNVAYVEVCANPCHVSIQVFKPGEVLVTSHAGVDVSTFVMDHVNTKLTEIQERFVTLATRVLLNRMTLKHV